MAANNIFFRWICDGKVVCGETPCNSASRTCPNNFFLCGSQCKPNFISCGNECRDGGFYCEKEDQNINVFLTGQGPFKSRTFAAFDFKRIVPFKANKIFQAMEFASIRFYQFVMSYTCYQIYRNTSVSNHERCCLPLNYRCDGSVECWMGETTVSGSF